MISATGHTQVFSYPQQYSLQSVPGSLSMCPTDKGVKAGFCGQGFVNSNGHPQGCVGARVPACGKGIAVLLDSNGLRAHGHLRCPCGSLVPSAVHWQAAVLSVTHCLSVPQASRRTLPATGTALRVSGLLSCLRRGVCTEEDEMCEFSA